MFTTHHSRYHWCWHHIGVDSTLGLVNLVIARVYVQRGLSGLVELVLINAIPHMLVSIVQYSVYNHLYYSYS